MKVKVKKCFEDLKTKMEGVHKATMNANGQMGGRRKLRKKENFNVACFCSIPQLCREASKPSEQDSMTDTPTIGRHLRVRPSVRNHVRPAATERV